MELEEEVSGLIAQGRLRQALDLVLKKIGADHSGIRMLFYWLRVCLPWSATQ